MAFIQSHYLSESRENLESKSYFISKYYKNEIYIKKAEIEIINEGITLTIQYRKKNLLADLFLSLFK